MSGDGLYDMLETGKRLRALEDMVAHLKGNVPGSTLFKMADDHPRDEITARLEDRITASEERAQLRLEIAMTKIDGKLDLISSSLTEVRGQGRETRNVILGAAVAVLLGVLAMLIGLKQVWIGGVQVGQVVQEAVHSPAVPPSNK